MLSAGRGVGTGGAQGAQGARAPPIFLKEAKVPFLVLGSALFVMKSAIFVQDNVAVYTNLRS